MSANVGASMKLSSGRGMCMERKEAASAMDDLGIRAAGHAGIEVKWPPPFPKWFNECQHQQVPVDDDLGKGTIH